MTSLGAGTIRPGGPRGEEGMTVKVGANGRQSGGGERRSSALDGRDDMGDTTSLLPPLLLSLSSSSSLSSAIAEEHVAGGVPTSADTDLGAIPADKEDVIDVDNDGAMVAAVIATPDITGGNDARETTVLDCCCRCDVH